MIKVNNKLSSVDFHFDFYEEMLIDFMPLFIIIFYDLLNNISLYSIQKLIHQ